jgi:hypothetical protein
MRYFLRKLEKNLRSEVPLGCRGSSHRRYPSTDLDVAKAVDGKLQAA